MARVTLNNVKKRFGKIAVIHGISMEIDNGELIVIVGPSGCGKSTLLRMVAGLERITEGTVSINDRVVNELEPRERDIAMVFQNYALYPHMSVFNNMAYGLKIAGMGKREIKKRVAEAAACWSWNRISNASRASYPGDSGSGWQWAGRLSVTLPFFSLMSRCPTWTPNSGCRCAWRSRRCSEILRSRSLYVTHDQVEAMTLADRMMVMHNGIAEQVGTPLEVYHNPATTFVAGFIGSPPMNFLAAEIKSGAVHLKNSSSSLICKQTDQPVTAGIRPEHLQLCRPGTGMFDATVKFTEALGAETLVHLVNQNGEDLIVRLDSSQPLLETGAFLGLDCGAEHVLLFDGEGIRLPAELRA